MRNQTAELYPQAHDESDLIRALEPDQLSIAAGLPLPPARTSRGLNVALLLLRIFSLVVTAMVIYVFVEQLRQAHS